MSVFTLILGTSLSQGLFYVSVDGYMKMSFNSTDPFRWDSKSAQVSNLFTYEHKSFYMGDPFRIGASLGMKIKPRHFIEIGVHYDGVSSKAGFRFASYQTYVDYYTPSSTQTKSRSQQSRFFLNYRYNLVNKSNKTNLSIFPSIGIVWRGGPKGVGNVGAFGTGGILIKDSLAYHNESTSYTAYNKYALQFGLGLQSDIFIRDKYWFSAHVQYAYSKVYLAYDVENFFINEINSGKITKYEFILHNRASGLYLGISRKFQIVPWKRKSNRKENAHNNT